MDEFIIGLVGQLEVDTTVKNIVNQMDDVSQKVNEARGGSKRLFFIGRLNDTKTQETIQAQLNTISENLRLEIKSDGLEGVIKSLKELGQTLSHISGDTGVKQSIDSQVESIDNLGGAFGRATKIIETYDGQYEKLLSHQQEYKRNGVTETLTYDVDEDGKIGDVTSTKLVRNTEAIAKAQERARLTAQRYAQEFQNIRDKYEGIGAAKPITRDDHLAELATAADKVDMALRNLQSASNETFDQLNNDYKVAKTSYEGLAKSFANMENMATKLKAKPISVIEQEQIAELNKFETGLKQAGISYDTLIQKTDGSQQTIGEGIQALRSELESASGNQQALLDYTYSFKELRNEIDLFKSQKGFFDTINSEMEKAGEDITKLQDKIKGSKFANSPEIEGFTEDLTNLQAKYQEFVNSIANSDPQALSGMAAEVKERSDAIVKEIGDMTNAVDNFHRAANNAAKNDLLAGDKQILSNRIQTWLNDNTKASEKTRQAMVNLQKQIEGADKARLTNITKQFNSLDKAAKAAGETGKKVFDVLKENIAKFTSWYSIGNVVATVAREFRNAIAELREMDTVLTEISKTSERTASDLELLGEQAFDTASQYGRTASDYLSGVLEMSRAGYGNAEAMAELSVKAQSAGDMTAELANQYLIATDAAYGLDGSVEQLSNILDGMNMVTNRNAVDMTKIASAMKIVGSQAASAGVSIEDTTALVGTMIATTQQSGETNARALRSVLMSLRQTAGTIDEETGEVLNADDLTKYEKAVNALGVSLKTVEDGAIKLRDPVEILKELSVAYNQLDQDDSRRANLLSAIGGRYRANALDALLKNWGTYEKMLQDFSEGQGSAAREAEKTANSWEGTLNKFENSMTQLVNNFVTSGRAEALINFFTMIVKGTDGVIDAFGAVGTAVTVLSAIMISKSKSLHFNYDAETKSLKLGEKALKDYTGSIVAATAKTIAMNVATAALNAVLSFGLSAAIGGVVSLISSWINAEDELAKKHAEEISKLKESRTAIQEDQKQIQKYIDQYEQINNSEISRNEKVEQLASLQEDIIDNYAVELSNIDLVNGKYEEQIELLKAANREKAKQEYQTNVALAKEAETTLTDTLPSSIGVVGIETEIGRALATIKGLPVSFARFRNGVEEVFDNTDYTDYSKLTSEDMVEIYNEAIDKMLAIDHSDPNATIWNQHWNDLYTRMVADRDYYLEEVQKAAEIYNEKARTAIQSFVSPEGIDFSNVTEETFEEWRDALLSHFNYEDERTVQAIKDYIEKNFKFDKSDAGDTTPVFGFSFSAYKEDVNTVTTEFTNLQKVIDKIDKGTYSTIEDGFGLLDAHPELLEFINDSEALRKKLVELQRDAPKDLVADLKALRKNIEETGTPEQIAQINSLITALENLGKTAVETSKALTIDDYLKIQTDGIDNIIDKLKDENDERKEVLENLNDQKSQIEDYYDAQINALKQENDERERNIDLQEKQLALDKAKSNKVRVYTNRGWQIQEDTEAVTKAQRDLDDAINQNQIAELEKQKSKAVAAIDKQIDAQKKEIKSYEDNIKEWEKYRKKLVDETNNITNINTQYLDAQKQFVLDEKSTFDEREANLKKHLDNIRKLYAEQNVDFDNAVNTALMSGILSTKGLSATTPIPSANSSNSKLSNYDIGTLNATTLPERMGAIMNSVGLSSGRVNNNFAPTVTFNISANKVDTSDIKEFWEKEIAMQYAQYKSGR